MELVMKNLDTLDAKQVPRRKLLIGAIAVGSAPLLAATGAQANVKLPKSAVKFTTVASNGRNCASCKLFQAPSSCTFVEGATDPNGTCWIWQSKSASPEHVASNS
jgi:hypothetical protein